MSDELEPGEIAWSAARKANPALLPWAKLPPATRERLVRAATVGCECGHCAEPHKSVERGSNE
jgi:hypothetical protein